MKQGQHLIRFRFQKESRREAWRNRSWWELGQRRLQAPIEQGHPSGLGITTDRLPLRCLGTPKFFLWFSFLIGKVPSGWWVGRKRPLRPWDINVTQYVFLTQDKAPSSTLSSAGTYRCTCSPHG